MTSMTVARWNRPDETSGSGAASAFVLTASLRLSAAAARVAERSRVGLVVAERNRRRKDERAVVIAVLVRCDDADRQIGVRLAPEDDLHRDVSARRAVGSHRAVDRK